MIWMSTVLCNIQAKLLSLKGNVVPIRFIRRFIKLESASGILLFAIAILALVLDNSPLHPYYQEILHTNFVVKLGDVGIEKPLILWINEGLMAIFFLSVGLEIKREVISGELSSFTRVALPVIAAIGGILVPAAIYIWFNWGDHHALKGWAIPTATDIAFALGVLSLLGKRIPLALKVFVMALAIFDDIGAILIIAGYYTAQISLFTLIFAAFCLFGLYLLNRYNVKKQEAYFFVGLILWVCVLKSGVHATLSGVVIAFAIPLRIDGDPGTSPLRDLESRLIPWVAFFVLPVFAFANAGVTFEGLEPHYLIGPLPMGIALGLLIGKQFGIFGASWLAIKSGLVPMPTRTNWLMLYGASLICGIGFTMSLFIGTLAFGDVGTPHAALVRFGVLMGSMLSGIFGYYVIRYATTPLEPQSAISHTQSSDYSSDDVN